VLAVVRATMARALRTVSTERGVDPTGLALVAYGGAGPLHASALARELGCVAVVVPPAPGVLSALGLLLAPARYEASRTVMSDVDGELAGPWAALAEEADAELRGQGVTGEVALTRVVDARYARQSHELRLTVHDDADIAELLHTAHQDAYGYAMRDEPVVVVTLRVVATAAPALDEPPTDWASSGESAPRATRTIGVGGEEVDVEVIDRASLRPGDEVRGPALIEQPDTTTLLLTGDVSEVDEAGNLVVRAHV
jgi:N-methylhydantoinase A